MRGKGWRFWGLAALLLAVNVCGILWIHHDLTSGPRPHVRILSVSPGGPADGAERFSLKFDEPLAATAMVGRPLAASPFVLKPQPEGRWQWTAADQLDFVLSKPLPPGRQYSLVLAPDGEDRMGHQVIGDKEFTFRTQPLELTGCNLLKTDPKKITFELSFNQPVHPVDVLEFMTLKDAKTDPVATLQATALSHEAGTKLVFQADRPKGGMVAMTLSRKLAGCGAELGLGYDRQQSITVPEKFVLLRAQTDAPRLRGDMTARLQFSENLDEKAALPEVTVRPEVKDLSVSRFAGSETGAGGQLQVRRGLSRDRAGRRRRRKRPDPRSG